MMIDRGFALADIPANRQSWFPELQGWFTDRECAVLAAIGRGCDVLEIGSWKGRSALAAVYGGAASVMCVDTWRGDAYTGTGNFWPEFLENAKAEIAIGRVMPVIANFRYALPVIDLRMYEVVHYDADHSAAALRAFHLTAMGIVHFHRKTLLVHDCDYPETREFIRSLNGYARYVDRLAVVTRDEIMPLEHQRKIASQLTEFGD
jgi:hypothetical protein